MDPDLVAAAQAGLLLLPKPIAAGVELTGRVLRYDPKLSPERRAHLVELVLQNLQLPQN